MKTRSSLFAELTRIPVQDTEVRADNAYRVAIRFVELVRNDLDEKRSDLVIKAWLRAVKDGNYDKFKRVYRKYTKNED